MDDKELDAMYNKALGFAMECHKGQVRKWGGQPAVSHPISVSKFAMARSWELGFNKVEINRIGVCSLLHDTIEDGQVKDIRFRIQTMFGHDIYDIVSDLTRNNSKETYWDYIARICRTDRVESLIVKYCDTMHNMTTLPLNNSIHERYIKSLGLLYPELQKALKRRKQNEKSKEKDSAGEGNSKKVVFLLT